MLIYHYWLLKYLILRHSYTHLPLLGYDVGIFVYVIAWVAVVFGINCASNVGMKLVIVRGAAEHYYCFLPVMLLTLIYVFSVVILIMRVNHVIDRDAA